MLQNLLVCVFIYQIFSIPNWIRSTRTPCDVRCVFSCVNTDLLLAMKNTVGLSVCVSLCVCVFRTDSGVATEPFRTVDLSRKTVQMKPSRTESGFPQRSVPAPINTHHVRHILQTWPSHSRSKKGRREIYPLSTTSTSMLVMWRNPGCACFVMLPKKSPLHFMNKLILLTNNHRTIICELKYWSVSCKLYFSEFLNLPLSG